MAEILQHADRLAALEGNTIVNTPRFAVVGHPNKGKSSIVATLAHDDRVTISSQSGTTTAATALTVTAIDSHFELIDTPGFQRPTRVLAWLKNRAASADQRAAAVAAFVEDPACREAFPDEVELLTPIVRGAAILYVVDGSRPYGQEYEAEMEILRWTGQASMALINPIENETHVEDWQQALAQYFRVVRVFNALQADFEKQLSVLEAFGLLREDWQASIGAFIIEAREQRRQQLNDAAVLLSGLLQELCSFEVSEEVTTPEEASALQSALETRFFETLRGTEQAAHEKLKRLFGYQQLDSEIYDLPVEENLFDTSRWIVWGLDRKQLATAAAMGGAAAGALVDLSVAGLSFGIATVGAGLLAGGSAWLKAEQIAAFKTSGLPLGGYEARQGPIRNPNFPYVVLGRFLYMVRLLQRRTHAGRDRIRISEGDTAELLKQMTGAERKALHSALTRLVQGKTVEHLDEILMPLITVDAG